MRQANCLASFARKLKAPTHRLLELRRGKPSLSGGPILKGNFAIALLAITAHLATGCASSGTAHQTESGRVEVIDHAQGDELPGKRVATLRLKGDYPTFNRYLVSPGDVLDVVYHLDRKKRETYKITIYHEVAVKFVETPKFNETQEVLPDGTISLPYIGRVEVTGMTTSELSKHLEKEYSHILRDPEIYVKIQNFNARIEQVRNDLHTSARGLSKLLNVRPDGKASFPLIGEVEVARRTIDQAEETIGKKYADYLPGLKADLFLHEQSGNNVYVVGEVNDPGPIQIKRPLNLIQLIARAGGQTRQGNISNTLVFRRKGQKLFAHRFNLEEMTSKSARRATNFYLRPDDILLVPRSKISSAAQLMQEISQILLFSGFSYHLGNANFDINSNN